MSELYNFRNEIIKDILTRGLVSEENLKNENRQTLDDIPGSFENRVYGIALGSMRDSGSERFKKLLHYNLYREDYSVLPILARRTGEDGFKPDLLELYERRIRSSLLVVCESLIGFETPIIEAKNIIKVLMPKEIYDDHIKDIVSPELIKERNITRVRGTLERNLLFLFKNLVIPNYEDSLLVMASFREDKPLWVRGVRLPTEEDLV